MPKGMGYKEKVTPHSKPVPGAGGLKEGSSNTVLTTPNSNQAGRYWGGKKKNSSIMGK